MTVLHVEDDPVDAKAFQRALDEQGVDWPVKVAEAGDEAIEMLREDEIPRPRLIVLDLSMPRMDGLEFLETIRDDEDLADSLVIVLTSSGNAYDRRRCYQLNVAGYVIKPFEHEELVEAVGTIVDFLDLIAWPEGESAYAT